MMRFFCAFFLLAIDISAQENDALHTFQSPVYQRIEHVALSHDNALVLAADTEGYILMWRKNDASLAKIMRTHNRTITGMALSANNNWLATVSDDNIIFVWYMNSGNKISEFSAKSSPVFAFNKENALLYSTGNALLKSPISEAAKSEILFQSNAEITAGASVQDGKYFAVALRDSLLLLDAGSGKIISKTTTCAGTVKMYSAADQVCCRCIDGTVQLFELNGTTLRKKNETNINASASSQFLLLPEQKNVLFTTETGKVNIWDWVSNKLFDAEELPTPVTTLGNAGEFILTGNETGEVFLRKKPFARGKTSEQPTKTTVNAPGKSLDERQIRFQESVEVQVQQLDIYVWDDENIDGDTISLSLNGEWILENYMVTKEKKKLTLRLVPEKNNTLVLYAENLGAAPPNTAVISFNDGNKERSLTLNSDLKRCDAVHFILKK